MEEFMKLYESVRSVPDNAQKPIRGGRLTGMTDINPMWRIKVLTERFGPCGIGWYYIPIKKWLEQVGNEVVAFVDIEFYIKHENEWSKPIFGTGGSMLATKESKGIHVSDECYKMATTDAISVACKQLGIGADVYWNADKTKYDSNKVIEEDPCLSDQEVKNLQKECDRTGCSNNAICKQYQVKQFKKMDKWQYEDAMARFSHTPDKSNSISVGDTTPTENEDQGLPWN